jgi:hypothetical protein
VIVVRGFVDNACARRMLAKGPQSFLPEDYDVPPVAYRSVSSQSASFTSSAATPAFRRVEVTGQKAADHRSES